MKTDNGTNFTSCEFKNFLSISGVEHRKSTPLWPQANGEVERQNRSILKILKIAQIEKKDWKRELSHFLLACRSTPHNTTGVSTAEALFSKKVKTELPDIKLPSCHRDLFEDRDNELKQKGKDYADMKRHARESDIQLGQTKGAKLVNSSIQ